MPVMLEQVIPSWMRDGLDIIGQQSDVTLDDDTPWDTTIWTTGEPEQVQLLPSCCCPDSVTVTFHDVLIDCGCQVIGGDSVIVTEVGFNGVPITLTKNISCGTISGFCHLVGSTTTSFHHKVWTNTHCTGSPIIDEDTGSTFDLVLLSGTWYLLSSAGQFVFYATSPSMTGPFVNTVVCDPVCCSTWFVPFCPPGHNSSFSGVAHGGSATVTVP